VLANPQFGTVISESGQAYTWHENAHEFRLTPWHNDPVSDGSGEAFYLRDEQSGQFWSPTALPARGNGAGYVTRHGFGYSVFEHIEAGIFTEMTTFVAVDAPIKYTVLKVRNDSLVARRLSGTGYVEWVLGDMRSKSGMHIITEVDPVSGALFAKNAYNTEFTGRVAFFNCDATLRSISGDRTEFMGRNGTLAAPAALRRSRLSGKQRRRAGPCAAIQAPFDLLPGQEREIVFVLGVGGRRNADASSLVQRTAAARRAGSAGRRACTLGSDPERGAHRNAGAGTGRDRQWLADVPDHRLPHLGAQRLLSVGGAFGFRDQLQDAMATIHTQPQLLRDQLMLCAAHQFLEGDVQHWWHPPSDRGVRTHCSDDYLWLPLGAWRYVTATGDMSVLEESAPYLEGRAVKPEEDSYYDLPARSGESGTLYDHCVRAIRNGLRFGEHGLPLIGSCDWNDGMDKVGEHGKGESVWLAFFLCEVLQRFAEVADLKQDAEFANECRIAARTLAANVEKNAWDGEWYRRAYFDDGTPLGSHLNQECQIDSISQSWGVLSGAADPVRVRGAMEQVNQRLVRRGPGASTGIIQLLDPPFDKAGPNPGYIRGYVPGVRENGGQYTHAAIWTAMAFARLGETERAWELARMINPVMHGATPEGTATYKVEPYVVTADVYAVAPHVGRGGWSWYTGSSGWMYRLIIESLLGLTRTANHLTLTPRMPETWTTFTLTYRHGASSYVIRVVKGDVGEGSVPRLTVDGVPQHDQAIELRDTGSVHQVELLLPPAPMAAP
jgi:cyclic beta-1,2-glucan synthetase